MFRGLMQIAWIASFILVFSGCFGKMPQIQYYEIEALNGVKLESKKIPSRARLCGRLVLRQKLLAKIAYKNNANSIAYFSKNAWIEPFL